MTGEVKGPSRLVGISIVAGATVGAGMFALPVASAGMWFNWSIIALLFSWFCLYHSSLMILETNLNYTPGASFDTFVKDTIGKGWNVVNGITLAFILYILAYAYISGGGSIVSHTLDVSLGISLPPIMAGLIFAIGLSSIVWVSTGFLGRMNAIFVGGMLITFILSVGDLTTQIKLPILLDTKMSYTPFVFAALPYFLASFGFHTSVPSLVKFYGKNPNVIRDCLFYGTLISLVIYALWMMVVQGNISRADMRPVIDNGGNIGDMVGALTNVGTSSSLAGFINAFANLAVVSSFLGAAIGLFDYMADKFKLGDSGMGRLKTALICFVPPTIGGVFFPNGFHYAIGLVGLCGIVVATLIPALCVRASRKKHGSPLFRVRGGDKMVIFILGYSVVLFVCYFLSIAGVLPVY
ncbi:MAG: tryptophan permease [Kordiimonadaceae bacterium]|nr:tryptophan permease [Kordiimonadaceae bacterium]MBT7581408.1 tryptophan permease [Kordiimonadaceae bacterium]